MEASVNSPDMEHVLIIEDDERLAELTRDYLVANGFRVTLEPTATEGHNASSTCNRTW